MTLFSFERFELPSASETLPAPLFERLARILQHAAVGIVAPEATGKTTLLAQFGHALRAASEEPLAVAWLSVAHDDVDRRQFNRSLARAFAHVGIGVKHYDQMATLADTTPELAVAALADDLTAHPDEVVLLIDDADRLGESSARLLWMLCGAAKDQLQVAVSCTPEAPVLTAPRPPATPLSLVAPDAWAAPLDVAHPHLEAALARLAPNLTEILTDAALLYRWDDAVFSALRLNAPPHWQAAVEEALPVLRQGTSLVPGRLLRQLLRTRLAAQPERLRHMQRQVGHWHATRGRTLEAVRALTQADAADDALPLVQEMLPMWYRAGDWRMVVLSLQPFALTQLPSPVLADLATAQQELGDLAAVDLIEAQLKVRGHAPAGMAFVRALRAFREGDLPRTLEISEAGLQDARTSRDRVQLQRVLAAVLIQQGRIAEAGEAIQGALALADALSDVPMLINVLSLHGFQLEAQGEYQAALAVHERTFTLVERHRHDNNRLLLVAQRLASLRREAGDLDGALNILEVALQRLQRTHPEAVPVLLSARSAVHLTAGQLGQALADADRAVSLAELWWGKAIMFDALFRQLEIQLAAGDLDAASHTLARTQSVPERFPANMRNEYLAFEAALLALRGHLQEAAALVQRHGLHQLSDWLDYGMMSRAVVLLAAYERGEPLSGALDVLRRSMTARAPYALTRPLRLFPQLTPILEAHGEPQVAALGRLAFKVARRPVLRVTTLDTPRLMLDGIQLRTRTGTAELLAYLALAPGQEELGTRLASSVIPPGGRTPQRKRLQVNRKELDESVAVARPGLPALRVIDVESGKEGRMSLSSDVTVECDALELFAGTAEDVMRLYRMPFLQDLQTDWAEEMRARFTAHAAALLRAAAHGNRSMRGLQYLLRLIEIEPTPLEEDFEAALRLAEQLDRPDVIRSLRRAQVDVEQGETPVLSALVKSA
ncbi:AAA family ATPase [Deinococcus multiflagellatus]|uniref:AAA family ATPase n=1 Tax=Deinococcus multiflagellatus TaxID=1656887 RepID=A0ABW1ZNU2_9DEIO|nr:AAA family ATPase [Deinococcus multiflagellatus]MBZ9714945.1 AAA family ATPase [Deinococcus multiflagellatus]